MQAPLRNGLAGLAVVAGVASVLLQGGPPGASLLSGLGAALMGCLAIAGTSPRWGVLVASLLALGCNGYLFSRKLEGAVSPSLCNVNEVLNCDVVNMSAASELFGIPVTLFGVGLYLGLALATLYKPQSTPRLFQVTGLLAIASLAFSAYLGYEATKLGAFCALCVTIYASNAILLYAAVLGLRAEGRKLFGDLGPALTDTSSITVVGVFLVVLIVGVGNWETAKNTMPGGKVASSTDPNDPSGLGALFTTPRGPIELDGTEPVLGDPNAPYLIVEWADFGCPHCAKAAEELPQLVREYPVQVRFKVFPLSGACNPALEGDAGPERCRAAQAAECAHRQGKFWEYSHLMFMNQTYLGDSDLAYMAQQGGLDLPAWNACMADPSVMQGVIADAVAGARAGVRGTPALFLRGTHGDQFVEMTWGPAGALKLIEAHQTGVSLPPPSPPAEM